MTAVKFARLEGLPEGFLYRAKFLTETEESELLRIFRGLNFAAYNYHGYTAKRRVAGEGATHVVLRRK
jgi:hypothetical protein